MGRDPGRPPLSTATAGFSRSASRAFLRHAGFPRVEAIRTRAPESSRMYASLSDSSSVQDDKHPPAMRIPIMEMTASASLSMRRQPGPAG